MTLHDAGERTGATTRGGPTLHAVAVIPDWITSPLKGCATIDPEVFFSENEAEARKACATCPFLTECREWGAAMEDGVYGGQSARERGPQARRAAKAERRERVFALAADGLTAAEIAEEVGLSRSGVAYLLSNATAAA